MFRSRLRTAGPALAVLFILGIGVLPAAAASKRASAGEKPAMAAGAKTLDARTRGEVLDALEKGVTDRYVEADTARMIADAVRKRAKAGAYDRLTDPSEFAEAVTRDLRSVNGDLHLSLRFDPTGSGPLSAGGAMRRVIVRDGAGPPPPGGRQIVAGDFAGAAAGGPVRRVVVGGPGPGPGAPAGPGPGSSAFERNAIERNFGLTRVEVLPGNIGYLEISGFLGVDGADQAVDEALGLLRHTDAVIIDVRRNGGGSGMMSHYVFSHFLSATPVPTIRVKSREEGMSRVQESLAEVGGPRRPDVPLYVLTSRRTGSAAEEFSFVLKNLGRAILVGERTAGAGHMVAGIPLPAGFVAGVSITRVSDPRTGAEWEGIGVQPDVAVPAGSALETAEALALRRLAAAETDPMRKRRLELAAEWNEAKSKPHPLTASDLQAIVGTYEGDRRVENDGGRPTIRRGTGGLGDEMVPIGDGSYAVEGMMRVRFAPGSPSPAMIIERADGSAGTYPREDAAAHD